MLRIKRAYEKPSPEDGQRILVERLWPRGLTKARAAIDLWMKEIAPTPALRKWFAHDPIKWNEFQQRYFRELRSQPQKVDELRARAKRGRVTLIYAAHDELHNGAQALKRFIERGRPRSVRKAGGSS